MSVTRSTAVKPAKSTKSSPPPKNSIRSDARNHIRNDVQNDARDNAVRDHVVRHKVRNNLRNAVRSSSEAAHKPSGFGLPCANCRLYYPANLAACPACNSKERVSPRVVPAIPKVQTVPVPVNAVVEQKNEAFLKKFKSQLFVANAEASTSPAVCTLAERHLQTAGAASICKPCYDRLQQRMDVCEAAMHMDVKEAAQVIHDAVWADPSEASQTYINAASALLAELRKRSGVSSLPSPHQPRAH